MNQTVQVDGLLGACILGFIMGLSAFAPPGPVIIYIVQQSLEKGVRGGLAVVLASAVVGASTLVLIIATGIGTFFQLSLFHQYIGFVGGVSFVVLGGLTTIKSSRFSSPDLTTSFVSYRSPFLGGVMANLFNPLVYLWWAVVGIPGLGVSDDLFGIGGIFSWSVGILGSMILWYGGIAYLASRGKDRIPRRMIKTVSLATGIFLAIFGVFLLARYVGNII